MKKKQKALLAVSALLLIFAGAYASSFMSVLGADELNLYTASLTIDGSTRSGEQQVIVFDKDGLIVVSNNVPQSGYRYPTMYFTVGNLRYEGVFDNITVETKLNETHIQIDSYVIYRYTFNVWIYGDAAASVVKNVYSAYEGKFATESPYQPPAPLNFIAKIGLKIEPFSFTDANDYGVTWMQLSNIKIIENTPSQSVYPPSPDVVWYSSDRMISNVGATWGTQYKANDLIGKELPTEAFLSIYGSYRAGSVCLYDPNNIIPGDLYQVVPIEPVFELTCTLHIAGHSFYIEDTQVPGVIAPPPPPPPTPSVIDKWLLLVLLIAAAIPITIFGVPRIIKALKSRRG